MKKSILLVLVFLSWLAMPLAYAIKVDSIYQANVPVASQTEADRIQGEKQGLGQVLIKVSGNGHILDDSDLASNLGSADAMVEEFSYSSSPGTPATPYILTVSFDEKAVNHLLQDAGVTIWGKNRPLVLAWIEYEEPNKPAEIIESGSSNTIQKLLTQYAAERGLPIILPVMDMTDLNKVTVNDIVTMAIPAIQHASQRYSSDTLLIARILKVKDGFSIQSKMLMGNNQWDWNITDKSIPEVLSTLLNNISDILAGHYAVSDSGATSQLVMKVSGISEQNDLAQVIQYISNLTPVSDVEPIHVGEKDVVLKISLHGSKDTFIQSLAADKKMQPLPVPPGGNAIEYTWNH